MADEHDGHGGSYIIDKKTGKRKLIQRTAPPKDEPKNEQPPPAAPETQGDE